jgi:hypothetical protein
MSEKETSQDVNESFNESSTEWDGALHGVRLYLGAFGYETPNFLERASGLLIPPYIYT